MDSRAEQWGTGHCNAGSSDAVHYKALPTIAWQGLLPLLWRPSILNPLPNDQRDHHGSADGDRLLFGSLVQLIDIRFRQAGIDRHGSFFLGHAA